jgi:RNA-directed DNA polymerase
LTSPKVLIWEAYQNVKVKGDAAGIDQQTIEQFEQRLGDNLYKLWNRMCFGSYFPPPVKSVPIPKKTGGIRVPACRRWPTERRRRSSSYG